MCVSWFAISKMHCVSCPTVCVVFIALVHFAFLRQAAAADAQQGADRQRHSQPTRYTRSVSTRRSHRLPSDLLPLHYDLVIHPDIYQDSYSDFSFEGRVTIKMKCISPTKAIVLNAKSLTIAQSDIVVSGPAGNLSVVSMVLNDQVETLNISLEEELKKDENYTVQIDFSGPLRYLEKGLYFNAYKRGDQFVFLAATHFKTVHARKAFPCMDEPALKATFTIHVIRRSFNLALSNMPVKASTNLDGDKVVDHFETSFPMSTYLVAFVVCDFAQKTNMTNRNVQVEVWSQREVMDQLDFALDFGVKTIDFLEEYVQEEYPLPKLSMVGIPYVLTKSTENWGLIMCRDNDLLFKDQATSMTDKMRKATNIAQKISHMWFGNLVTAVWWDDFWLSEALAWLMRTVVYNHFYSDRRMMDVSVAEMEDAMKEDGLVWSRPLVTETFDTLSYYKGSFVVHMLHFAIGDDKFRKGIQKYLSTWKYGSAKHTDLWNILEDDELEVSIVDVMDTWTLQMNYPVVTVTVEGQNVTLTQERFLQNPESEDPGTYTSPFGYKWHIPFTFTSSDEQNFDITSSDIIWFTKDEDKKTFAVPTLSEDSWVLGNVRLKGYYRVNYDDNNWRKLTAQLRDDHTVIDPLNRAQIISDAWALASAGLVSRTTALDAVEYLDKETEYTPWSKAFGELESLGNKLSNTDVFLAFKAFVAKTANPLYAKLAKKTPADYIETGLRKRIVRLACIFDGPECVNDALTGLQEWKMNPDRNEIFRTMPHIMYCTGLRQGNTDDWDFVFERFQAESDHYKKKTLLNSLSCTNNSKDLNRLLDWALNSGNTSSKNFFNVLRSTILNPVGANTAWTFINSTWDSHPEKYDTNNHGLQFTIKFFGDAFYTQDQLRKLQDFLDRHGDLGRAGQAFLAAMESIPNRIAWMEKNAGIKNWLQERGYSA